MSSFPIKPSFESKIVPLNQLADFAKQLPKPVVFTNGIFDILHRGHVTYLAQARSLGASLIVAVNSDTSVKMQNKGDDRPINPQGDRAAIVAALESVSLVTIFDSKVPLDVVRIAKPDIYVKGGDYKVEDLPEAKVVIENGGRVEIIKFDFDRSTTKLLEKIRSN